MRVSIILLASLAGGTFLGAVFLKLLPVALANAPAPMVTGFVLAGIALFYFVERVVDWHQHAHQHERLVGPNNLIGDGLHNFFDGLAIGAGYIISPATGIIATVAVIMHEIPQEIGDVRLMIKSGFRKEKAVVLNLFSALLVVSGGVGFFAIYYYAGGMIPNLEYYGLSLACGMFIYIAVTDLSPDLHREILPPQLSNLQFALVLVGILFIASVVAFVQ